MKKRIILFALSLAVIVGMLSAGNAYAWFSTMQGGSSEANRIRSGMVQYELGTGAFIVESAGDIYPEQNLLTGPVSLENSSNITTNVRIKITYTYGGSTLVWDPTNDACELAVTLTEDSGWTYNSTDHYLYRISAVAANADLPLFDKLCYSGPNTDNDTLAGSTETITVLYEARQAEYVNTWNFS